MASMEEMAREYRYNTAKFAERLKEKENRGADIDEINAMRSVLKEMRAIQRQLSSYYDAERDPEFSMIGYIAPRRKREDDG